MRRGCRRFYPSVSVTPEVVHPMAVEVLSGSGLRQGVPWVSLMDAMRFRRGLPDGHLRVVLLRAAHALGLIHESLEES